MDERIQASIDVIVGALLVTALLAAVAGLVAIGQAFARHASHERDGQADLAALGMTRRERRARLGTGSGSGDRRWRRRWPRSSPSWRQPCSRSASLDEPSPTRAFDVDAMVLVLGTAGVLLVLTAIALLAAIPASRDSRPGRGGRR